MSSKHKTGAVYDNSVYDNSWFNDEDAPEFYYGEPRYYSWDEELKRRRSGPPLTNFLPYRGVYTIVRGRMARIQARLINSSMPRRLREFIDTVKRRCFSLGASRVVCEDAVKIARVSWMSLRGLSTATQQEMADSVIYVAYRVDGYVPPKELDYVRNTRVTKRAMTIILRNIRDSFKKGLVSAASKTVYMYANRAVEDLGLHPMVLPTAIKIWELIKPYSGSVTPRVAAGLSTLIAGFCHGYQLSIIQVARSLSITDASIRSLAKRVRRRLSLVYVSADGEVVYDWSRDVVKSPPGVYSVLYNVSPVPNRIDGVECRLDNGVTIVLPPPPQPWRGKNQVRSRGTSHSFRAS